MTDAFRVDLTNCDREPIHILGAVQPFGFLVAVTADWLVSRVSQNLQAFTGKAPAEVLGRPVTELFGAEAVHGLRNRIALLRGEDSVERVFGVTLFDDVRIYDVAVHYSGRALVIEAEPALGSTADTSALVRGMTARIRQSPTTQQFLQEAARQVRGVTGFDRVMVYRFDPSGAGEVVAESRASGIDSFLGLHYPASDIPAQARALYVRNIFRIIADVDARPALIEPQFDSDGAPLDLSLSVLRAVSPIHLEYLRNMGVAASLSISIVVEGRLWGLFACHHHQPRLPSFAERTAAELFGSMFSLMLEARERADIAGYEAHARRIADRLMTVVAQDDAMLGDADWLASIVSDAIPCDGAGVFIDGRLALSGATPPEDAFRNLATVLNRAASSQVFTTDRIASLVPEAQDYAARAAGLLAIPISRSPRDYVVLFRAEQLRAVRWAGDPEKPVEYGPHGARLTPRKSFEEWSELVKGTAQPFTEAELRVAEAVRAALIEVVLRLSDAAGEERRRAEERQHLLIAELNHRVRNILALIRGLISQTRRRDGSPAEMLATLDDRVLALARAHDQITADRWGPASLRALIETEAAAFLSAKRDRVRLDGPEVNLLPEAFTVVALVVHELITNASKYGALSDNGRVDISWSLDAAGLNIAWRESAGPAVTAPSRRGFGSTIIEKSIPHDLGGRAEARFKLTGVEADFFIPARLVAETRPGAAAGGAPAPEAEGEGRPLEGRAVLLLEDSLMVALDCEPLLLGLGAEAVHVAAAVAAAEDWLAGARIDFAVLDLNLGPETSLGIADALAARGTPFIFATGYGEQALTDRPHAARPKVSKPYTAAELRRAIAAELAGEG